MADSSQRTVRLGARSLLRTVLRTAVALLPLVGLTAIASGAVAGCPRTSFREDAALTLDVAEAARGTTTTGFATYRFLNSNRPLREFTIDVASSPDADRIGGAPPPPGITFEHGPIPDVGPLTHEVRVPVTITVAADAPLRPIYVRADFLRQADNPDVDEYHYAIQPFRITLGAGAPGVGAAIPAVGIRGTSVDVEIPASNVVGAVSVDPLDPWITATNTTYDVGTSRVRTTLEIAPDARTGETILEVVNGDGVHSVPVPFTVSAAQPAPAIDELFPNVVRSNQAQLTVLAAGSGFTTGTLLDNSAPGVATLGAANVDDSHTFTVQVALPAEPVLGALGVSAETVGGRSAAATLQVVPPGATVPTLTGVVPSTVVTNTSTLVRVESADLDLRGPFQVVSIGSDAVAFPFLRAEIVPGSVSLVTGATLHPSFAIVRLVGAPGDPSVGGTPTGTVHLALRNVDGLTSRALPLVIAPRPTGSGPFIRSVTVGRIQQGGEVVEQITGERLRHVERVFVESGGVELKRDVRVQDDPSGTSITVTLVATDDAPLTGDAATNLVVVTRAGTSNRLVYEVAAPSGGGECSATSGAQLVAVATGASGYRKELNTADSAIDQSTESGEVRIDHRAPDFNRIRMYVRTAAADLVVGTYTAVNVIFNDGQGNTWFTTDAPQVRVVATGPNYVVFCLDNVLGGEGTNDDIRLTGYVVMSR